MGKKNPSLFPLRYRYSTACAMTCTNRYLGKRARVHASITPTHTNTHAFMPNVHAVGMRVRAHALARARACVCERERERGGGGRERERETETETEIQTRRINRQTQSSSIVRMLTQTDRQREITTGNHRLRSESNTGKIGGLWKLPAYRVSASDNWNRHVVAGQIHCFETQCAHMTIIGTVTRKRTGDRTFARIHVTHT